MADTEFFKGDSLTLNIEVTDGSGGAVDLSDALESEYGIFDPTGAQVVTKSLGSGISIAINVVTINLLPADTANVAPGRYVQELYILDADSAAHRPYQGDILLKRSYILAEVP